MRKLICFLLASATVINSLLIVHAAKTDYAYAMLGLDKFAEYIQTINGSETVVAVLDSGIAETELLSGRLVPGYDFVDDDETASEDHSSNSHGTRIAGIIAAATQDLPVSIMPVRILEERIVSIENLVAGIRFAVDHGASVINLSVGGRVSDCSEIDSAISYAAAHDVVMIFAAGNEYAVITDYCPAHNACGITVSSVDSAGQFAKSFSNFGECVDCCAPGVSIDTFDADGEHKEVHGTSFSAAFITAGVALMRCADPELSANEIQEKLKSICMDLGEEGHDHFYGYGLPQFQKLVPQNSGTPTIRIHGYQKELHVDYRTTLRFTAVTSDYPAGAQTSWLINGINAACGETCIVEQATKSFTIQVRIIDADDQILAESEVEIVHVKTGFFARLIAFLRALFCLLPKLEQEHICDEPTYVFLHSNNLQG